MLAVALIFERVSVALVPFESHCHTALKSRTVGKNVRGLSRKGVSLVGWGYGTMLEPFTIIVAQKDKNNQLDY